MIKNRNPSRIIVLSSISSVGKVDDSEVLGSNLATYLLRNKEYKIYQTLTRISLQYENIILKDLMAALESEHIIYMKLKRTKSNFKFLPTHPLRLPTVHPPTTSLPVKLCTVIAAVLYFIGNKRTANMLTL